MVERPLAASKPVCQVGGLNKAEQVCAVESAEEQPVWPQVLVVEAVQAGPQVVMEGADSVGPEPIEPVYFESAWTVQRSAMIA